MEYVGIDLHKKESQICLLTETGEVMERRIRTEPSGSLRCWADGHALGSSSRPRPRVNGSPGASRRRPEEWR